MSIIAFNFSPRHFWNLCLAIFAGAVVALWFFGGRVPSPAYRKLRLATLSLSVVLTVLYCIFNLGGLFALGGRSSGAEQLFLVLPVLTPLIMLICLVSVGSAALVMWLVFAVIHSYYWSLSHWDLHEVLSLLRFEWPLYIVALLLTIVARQDNSRKVLKAL
jgi:hypothetical protein